MTTALDTAPAPAPATDQRRREGSSAPAIESMTARIPSDAFLYAALGSIAGSLTLQVMGRKHEALFVGQWAPTFLLLGLHGQLVKGRDRG